jgi:hypothetical protein
MDISTSETKEVVLGLGKALNDENYDAARRYVSDNMKYVGPFGSRDGAEAYLHEIERLRLKFDIQKIQQNFKVGELVSADLSSKVFKRGVAGYELSSGVSGA